ncbi:methyltransferase [Streptomyces lasiicapitis]|uniref:methyltransferase n=1 Tax=Streptomyces lasiicapitis TaxID=1923961 RepID=UPI0036CEF61C
MTSSSTPAGSSAENQPHDQPDGRSDDQSQPSSDEAIALIELLFGSVFSSALRTAAVHRVADHLAEGPLPVDELARRAEVHADSLRRVLRLLASRGVFRETEPGVFELTPAAHTLRDVPGSLRDGVLFATGETMTRSFGVLEDAVREGKPGFEIAYGALFFDHLSGNPEDQESFDKGMSSLSGPLNDIIATAYPFPAGGTVVDVAGGQGGLLRAVLQHHPGLSGVLFDQEQTVAGHLLDVKELAGRWRVESGDFFRAVPEGGDLYVLKNILHDWSDEHSLRILASIRAVIPPTGRLLVVDTVMPEGNDPDPSKVVDIIMLNVASGRERTEDEFNSLFQQAGFTLTRIVETGSFPAIVEGVPV